VTLVTPRLFADLRVPTDRPASIAARSCLGECTAEELRELARTVSFGGFAVVDYGLPGYDGVPVCERLTCIDSQPPPRRYPNQWRIETNWEKVRMIERWPRSCLSCYVAACWQGGWIEWGARKDNFGQALYVEHWMRLPRGDGNPHLVLRRACSIAFSCRAAVQSHVLWPSKALRLSHHIGSLAGCASEGCDGLLLVVDDHFILLDDRPTGRLPTVIPGENGHPKDRGDLTVLAAQAMDCAEVCISMNRCEKLLASCGTAIVLLDCHTAQY